MKRSLKCTAVLMSAIIILTLWMPVSANGNIEQSEISNEPILGFSHCSECVLAFTVLEPDVAYVTATYCGYSNSFFQAGISVQIQKRFLGLFWRTVDIGYPNNEWIAFSTDLNGFLTNSFEVDGHGLYRAIFKLDIYGKNGTVDERLFTIRIRTRVQEASQ